MSTILAMQIPGGIVGGVWFETAQLKTVPTKRYSGRFGLQPHRLSAQLKTAPTKRYSGRFGLQPHRFGAVKNSAYHIPGPVGAVCNRTVGAVENSAYQAVFR